MLKPVLGAEPISRIRAIPELPPVRGLGPVESVEAVATRRTVPHPFEQALRDAVVTIRETWARVETEEDPLAKHLGFKALNRGVGDSGFDPAQLSEADDQVYARDLLHALRGAEEQSFIYLDDAARVDLETLLRFEQKSHERTVASETRASAARDETRERVVVERLQQDVVRHEQLLSRLPSTPRPGWLRVLGALVAVASLGVLGVVVRQPGLIAQWFAGLPALRWSTAVGAVGTGLWGAWLGMDPLQRRAWMLERLQEVASWRQTAAQREAVATEALVHALKLFEEVDAACRREESAAQAVVQRRPGVQRYLSASGAVVAVTIAQVQVPRALVPR